MGAIEDAAARSVTAGRRPGVRCRLHHSGENHGPAIREPPDAATARREQGRGVDTFWTIITFAVIAVIVAAVVWALFVAPVWVPRHSGKP
jgi:Flp pilus assembly protein TadB